MTSQDLGPTSRSGRVPGLGIRSIRWTDPSSDARSDCTGLPPDADRVRHTRHSRLSQARYHVSRYHDPAARSQGVQGYHRYVRGEVQRSRDHGYRRCRSKRIHIWPSHCISYIGAKFVPMRKPKKLPGEVISEEYSLEYGTDRMEMHVGAVQPGGRALVIDDLIATGGTLSAAIRLPDYDLQSVLALKWLNELPDRVCRSLCPKPFLPV
ncbi:unnamed protein product, partial [Musa acuminata subsp. burmannicoides]